MMIRLPSQDMSLCLLLLLVSPLMVQAKVKPILQADRSWNGGELEYPEGEAEISAIRLMLEQGEDAPFHCHPVPTMGYVESGQLLLETKDGKQARFAAGDTVVEAMRSLHRGKALSDKAEIVVFYAGARNIPVTVFPEDKENFAKYCQQ